MTAAARSTTSDFALRRPLPAGAPLAYWRLGPTTEARYDVADRPMAGEMDPFFFLTKHKNFIPHEYPCRTEFAAERRAKRPRITAEPPTGRVWLPFGSPRVDLSGFWFRPTVLGTWAETVDRGGLGRRGGAGARHLRRRDPVRQWCRGGLDGALRAQPRIGCGVRGRAEGRPQRDPHLVRRPRRARRPLLFPARLPLRPRREHRPAGRRGGRRGRRHGGGARGHAFRAPGL